MANSVAVRLIDRLPIPACRVLFWVDTQLRPCSKFSFVGGAGVLWDIDPAF